MTPSQRRLGLNDVSILIPLPASPSVTSFAKLGGFPGGATPLVSPALYARVATNHGDVTTAYAEFHAVGIRFDLCERVTTAPCPTGVDGQIRIVFQAMDFDHTPTFAKDISLHATYPVPAADLAGVVDELRELGALLKFPLTSRLTINSGLTSTAPPSDYSHRMKTLISRYAKADRLARLTFAARVTTPPQPITSVMRGVESTDNGFVDITIPTLASTEQHVTLVDNAGIGYTATPVADSPSGFQLALQEAAFNGALLAQQQAAVTALASTQNPEFTTFHTTQCVACHVSTLLTARRAFNLGVEPSTFDNTFTSTHDLSIASGTALEWPQNLRAFGWIFNEPIFSNRVANESAMVVDEIELRFPPHEPPPPNDGGLPDPPAGIKRVFLTHAGFTGDLKSHGSGTTGLNGADKLCAAAAGSAQLGGQWDAWLSTSTVNAIDHVTGTGPWHLVDGTLVFPDRASLLVGPLVPIDRDEFGGYPIASDSVWTGTDATGHAVANSTCADWTSNFNNAGHTGLRSVTTATWTDNSGAACAATGNRLYCFER